MQDPENVTRRAAPRQQPRIWAALALGATMLGACGTPVPVAELAVSDAAVLAALQQQASVPDLTPLGRCDVAASLTFLHKLAAGRPAAPPAWLAVGQRSANPAPSWDGSSLLPLTPLSIHVPPHSRAAHFARAPFTLVLGSGYFGMFEHLGLLRAMARLGLQPERSVGISSGALAAGLSSCTSLPHAQAALMTISLRDFADPTAEAWRQGAYFAGEQLQRRLEAILAPFGAERLELCAAPASVLAFNTHTQRTVHLRRGPVAKSLRASAALPKLFMPVRLDDGDLYIDGGWLDPHGALVLQAGAPALVHRLHGLGPADTMREERALGRPMPDETLPTDPAHATLLIDNPDRLGKWSVFWQLEHDKPKLRRIVSQHEACALSWLLAPVD